jgi:hypothetical protein
MSPPRYIMCKELIRTAAEKEAEAEAEAAASILVKMSLDASSGAVATATSAAAAPITTKMPDSIVKDAQLSAAASSSGKSIRALCAAAKLVHSATLRFARVRPFHFAANGGCRRQEDGALVEDLVLQPKKAGVAPQPDVGVVPAVPEPEPEPARREYKDRHSWRRRRNVPAVVDEARDENVPEPAGGDAPACLVYKYRHSWRRRKVPIVVAGGGDDEKEPTTAVALGAVRSVERPRLARVSVVVAGDVAGICEATVAASSPEAPQPDLVPAAECNAMAPPTTLPVVEPIREGWQDRQKRRGRGERYAAIIAEVLLTSRRRHGGRGGQRRA